jgi:hypothetical protein
MGIAAQMNALAQSNATARPIPIDYGEDSPRRANNCDGLAANHGNPANFDTRQLVSRGPGASSSVAAPAAVPQHNLVQVRLDNGTYAYVQASSLIPSGPGGPRTAGHPLPLARPPPQPQPQPQPQPYIHYGQQSFSQSSGRAAGTGLSGGLHGGVDAAGLCYTRMMDLVEKNRLGAFYTPQKVRELARVTAERVNFENLRVAAQLPSIAEAIEFSVLSLYNIVILVDNSLSMNNAGHKADLQKLVTETTEIAAMFDHDGLDIRVLNENGGTKGGDSLTTSDQVAAVLNSLAFSGGTPIGRAIEAIHLSMLVPLVQSGRLAKPLMILVVTDGEPDSERHVIDTIRAGIDFLRATRFGEKACAYQFVQVGRDERATRFLSHVDNHREIGHVVDATGDIELEERQFRRANHRKGILGGQYSYYLWLQKILLGAIDPLFDALDSPNDSVARWDRR